MFIISYKVDASNCLTKQACINEAIVYEKTRKANRWASELSACKASTAGQDSISCVSACMHTCARTRLCVQMHARVRACLHLSNQESENDPRST